MSGRGGGGRGWRGRGRGPAIPGTPGAKDEDGNTIEAVAGPPADFPAMKLPGLPEQSARDQMLLMRRNDLWSSVKKSPFILELQDSQTEDVNTLMEWFMDKSKAAGSSSVQGAGAGGAASTAARRGKRNRAPLTSVIKLLSEYFPEELYSSSDRKYARLQDTYFKRAGKKDDTGLQRLDQLLQMENAAGGQGGGGDGEADEVPPDEEPHDTDDEEDMADDDYYQAQDFDDDEGYDDGFDDGGDDGAVF